MSGATTATTNSSLGTTNSSSGGAFRGRVLSTSDPTNNNDLASPNNVGYCTPVTPDMYKQQVRASMRPNFV